ncbi:MAG: peroxiredoxin [Pseudomonadota bacterium]|jgi:Peroxiredoxin|nr:MAG: peroxiredoxin [Pseudomonadota bacterium]
MLSVGSRAPEFTLADQDEREVSLTSLLNAGPLILYFYPADFTPICTRQACLVRDLHEDIRRTGLTVAGISPQSPATHREFRARYGLTFPLLSDPDKAVIRMYDVNGFLGFGVRRVTYLIDQGRIIRDAVVADLRLREHEAFIRTALAVGDGR